MQAAIIETLIKTLGQASPTSTAELVRQAAEALHAKGTTAYGAAVRKGRLAPEVGTADKLGDAFLGAG